MLGKYSIYIHARSEFINTEKRAVRLIFH